MKKWIVILLSLLLPLALPAQEAQSADDGLSFDMDEYLYGHVRDSYEWHITTVKGKPPGLSQRQMYGLLWRGHSSDRTVWNILSKTWVTISLTAA